MRATLLVALAACGGGSGAAMPDAGAPPANAARDIADTKLALDIAAMAGTATVAFAAADAPGATLEVGDLTIDSVVDPDGNPIAFADHDRQLDLDLPAAATAATIAYHYKLHEGFTGISKNNWSLVWPYFCGNMFPCHSNPADGTTFSAVTIDGVPAGSVAVAPGAIPSEAPSYQVAFAVGPYTELPIGTTTAGTAVSMWYRPNEMAAAMKGAANLVAAFDWYERTLGPYRFGPKVGGVPVTWGPGALGGMEHHPFWHVAAPALGDEETEVHESAHGWFGDGIRIACWEDFVLSEGTVNYLTGRALEVVAPDVGTAVWRGYANELATFDGTELVWPDSCGSVDILKDNLFTNAPYIRGAFFYRAVAMKTSPALVDQALHDFYAAHQGGAARMQDMIDQIRTTTGYDATACAQMWLRSTTIPAVGPCP